MKQQVFLFIIFFSFWVQSQEKKTIYVDEIYNIISESEFQKKNNSELYQTSSFDIDTAIVKRLSLKYFLGKLGDDKKNQLFKLLKHRNDIDTTKSIHIHYSDTLKPIKSFPKKDTLVFYKNGKHRHLISHDSFMKSHKKCEKSNSNKKIRMYHFFNHNEGHPTHLNGITWHKDNLKLLRKLFYNNSDNDRLWTIIIHSNGDYIINNAGRIPKKIWNELVKHKNWEKHYSKFKKDYQKLN